MHIRATLLLATGLTMAAMPAAAQIVVFDKGEQKVTLSGQIQPEYLLMNTPGEPATDKTFFRRLIVSAQVALTANWTGVFMVDFGRSEINILDASIQYTGWQRRGLLLVIGNQKLPFSRSFLTSGTKQSLAERPFTGDRTYGTLNRAMGIRLDAAAAGRRVQWSVALASATHQQNAGELLFDTPANDNGTNNEGAVVVGRLEWHPFGETPRDQGDFHTPSWRLVVAGAAYRWWNDGDRNSSPETDLASSRGFEVSTGVRGHGWSMDAEFDPVRATTYADAPAGGLFAGRVADVRKASVEAGYMVVNHRLEVAAGEDVLDARAYSRGWHRTSVGATWFFRDQAVKLLATYRCGANVNGQAGMSLHETIVQMKLAF